MSNASILLRRTLSANQTTSNTDSNTPMLTKKESKNYTNKRVILKI